MTTLLITILVSLSLIAFILAMLLIGIYNSLVQSKENIKQAWANIDVTLKQRYDEIPKLLSICEQYMDYEQKAIDKILDARSRMVHGSNEERMSASQQLSVGLQGLLSVGENYPDLQANKSYIQLQRRVSELEESLSDRREFYNSTVNNFNIRIQQIPDVFIARPLGYTPQQMFEVFDYEKGKVSLQMNIPS